MYKSSKKIKSNLAYLLLILFIFVSLSCLCGSNLASTETQDNQPPLAPLETDSSNQDNQLSPTNDPRTATVNALLTIAAAAQTESVAEPGDQSTASLPTIPGLNTGDLVVLLEDIGFSCFDVEYWEADELFPIDVYFRGCEKTSQDADLFIDIYGHEIFTIYVIQISVLEYSVPQDSISIPFLGYMATIPYLGAEPSIAQAWVEETIPTIIENGDGRYSEFGGIPFSLYGAPGSRLLIIGFPE